MIRSKTYISQVLLTLVDNIQRKGDPLGIGGVYWAEWAKQSGLPREGKTIMFTARMYQMLPYIAPTTSLIALSKPFLSRKVLGDVIRAANTKIGEKAIGWQARKTKDWGSRSTKILRGIAAALSATPYKPAYLYEDEPYSGALLYDLGLDEFFSEYINEVYSKLKQHGVTKVITVDPHTFYMLKDVYPKYINNYDIEVKHYFDILVKNRHLGSIRNKRLKESFVIHDSCLMARRLDFLEQPRRLLKNLGITVLEPQNTKTNTLCCGGPLESTFPSLGENVSRMRVQELAEISRNIVVTCPICYLNLGRYEQKLGIKVWDIGELLYELLIEKAT